MKLLRASVAEQIMDRLYVVPHYKVVAVVAPGTSPEEGLGQRDLIMDVIKARGLLDQFQYAPDMIVCKHDDRSRIIFSQGVDELPTLKGVNGVWVFDKFGSHAIHHHVQDRWDTNNGDFWLNHLMTCEEGAPPPQDYGGVMEWEDEFYEPLYQDLDHDDQFALYTNGGMTKFLRMKCEYGAEPVWDPVDDLNDVLYILKSDELTRHLLTITDAANEIEFWGTEHHPNHTKACRELLHQTDHIENAVKQIKLIGQALKRL